MKKVEADTLEEAYQKAATQLACSITDIEYEVIQHPSKGLFGFLKKKAIIVATCKNTVNQTEEKKALKSNFVSEEESVATAIISEVQKDSETVEEPPGKMSRKRYVKLQ